MSITVSLVNDSKILITILSSTFIIPLNTLYETKFVSSGQIKIDTVKKDLYFECNPNPTWLVTFLQNY